MTETTVPIPVSKRADQLVVSDRILPHRLPAPFFKDPGEVVFVKVHDYRKGRYVFVAYMQDNGFYDSTSYEPDGEVEVYPAPAATGLDYSRPADDPQPSGGREPMHTGAMTDGGLVDESDRADSGLIAAQDWDAALRETVHWRSSGLPRMVIACGAESGPHSADLAKVTCPACLEQVPF